MSQIVQNESAGRPKNKNRTFFPKDQKPPMRTALLREGHQGEKQK